MNRTTTNMLRCLLFQVSLPASYWAEALHTATHLLNRLPSKAVRHPTLTSPYTAQPLPMITFACSAVPATLTLPLPPLKLPPRSTRCLFLGYSPDHKGYRCLDLTSHRIIISRHVVFDEDVFPLAGSTPPTDLDSLLESDSVPPPPPAPRLAPLPTPRAAATPPLTTSSAPRAASSTPPAPRAATSIMPAPRTAPSILPAPRAAPTILPAPRAAPSIMPAPRAAPSTPARFANPALVYHRRGHATTSAPPDSGPSTSAARFADPAVVYHRREPATTAALDVPAVRSESSVYHPVAIHRDPGHIHPMVTRAPLAFSAPSTG
jgi:hypothetical protein